MACCLFVFCKQKKSSAVNRLETWAVRWDLKFKFSFWLQLNMHKIANDMAVSFVSIK